MKMTSSLVSTTVAIDREIDSDIDEVIVVADNIKDVVSVADNISGVIAIAPFASDISTVIRIESDVVRVSAASSDVELIADHIDGTVSTHVTTVGTDLELGTSSLVKTVSDNILDVGIVADNDTDITTVSDNIDGTTSTIIPDVHAELSRIGNVSDNISDVTNYADVYYGPKASEPTLRNDGTAIVEGDMYFNTATKRVLIFDGTIWAVNPVNTSLVETFDRIGEVTHSTTIQDTFNHTESAGVTNGCELTDNLNGTVTITAGEAYIRATDDEHSTLFVAEVVATVSLTMVADSLNIVYLDYNLGSLVFKTTAAPELITMTDKIPAYYIYAEGTTLHIRDIRFHNINNTAKHQKYMHYTQRETRGYGGTLGNEGTLHLSVTASRFYFQLTPINSVAINTTGTDTFARYYQDGIGGWSTEQNQVVVSNTNYDDGTGTLGLIGTAKFGVEWYYLLLDNTHTELVSVYGSASYNTQSDAEAAKAPANLPGIVANFGVLIGRTIIQQGGTELTSVESAFTAQFSSSLVEMHNNLAGLNDGEFQHLTVVEKTKVDADSIKLDNVTITQAVNLDSIESDTAANNLKVTNVITDLSISTAVNTVTVNSSDGTNATIGEATATIAGVMSTAHHDKLDGIEVDATADQLGSEIKIAYEAEADTNAYTDIDILRVANTSNIDNTSDADKPVSIAVASELALKANQATTINNTNSDQTKIGSFTVGESISVTGVANDGTKITLSVVAHNAIVGNTIYVSGLNLGNGEHIVTEVTPTAITYASTALATTVSSALVKYGKITTKGDIPVATNESKTLWSGSAGVSTITVDDMSENEVLFFQFYDGTTYTYIHNVPYELFKSGVSYRFVSSVSTGDYLVALKYLSDTSIEITQIANATLTKVYGKGK